MKRERYFGHLYFGFLSRSITNKVCVCVKWLGVLPKFTIDCATFCYWKCGDLNESCSFSVDSTHVSTEHHVVFSPSDCVDGVTTVGLLGVMRIKAISFLMSMAPPLRNSVILFLTFCDTVFLRPANA